MLENNSNVEQTNIELKNEATELGIWVAKLQGDNALLSERIKILD